MTNKLLGLTLAAAAGTAVLPAAASAQEQTCPPGTTNPAYCTGTDETTARDDVAGALGLNPEQVRRVAFGAGGVLLYGPAGDADRGDLRSRSGLLVGRFVCSRAGGCDIAVNVRFRLGCRTFSAPKTVARVVQGKQGATTLKVPSSRRALLGRATVLRAAVTLRLRDPRTGAILGVARRHVRLRLG